MCAVKWVKPIVNPIRSMSIHVCSEMGEANCQSMALSLSYEEVEKLSISMNEEFYHVFIRETITRLVSLV
jgi:hypothetical protein